MHHRGPRVEGAEYFDDMENANSGGVLGGIAEAQFDSVAQQVSKDGLQVNMSCRLCGRPVAVIVTWEELFVIGSNGPGLRLVMPAGWAYSQANGTLYPQLPCGKCAEGVICPHFTPDEARALVNQANAAGWISPAQTQAWGAKVAAIQGRG